jgi:hypothetical protein
MRIQPLLPHAERFCHGISLHFTVDVAVRAIEEAPMHVHSDRLKIDNRFRVPATVVIAIAVTGYLGVSALLEATGIDVPFVKWPF